MKTTTKMFRATLLFCTGLTLTLQAQDLSQAPSNYGLTSVLDGAPPAPGVYIMEYFQYYTGTLQDPDGNDVVFPNQEDALGVNTTLLMNQLVWITPLKVLGGNFLLDGLVPIVDIGTTNSPDLVGRSGIGDVIVGAGVQWFNKKLFGKPYIHRAELDFFLPTGAYNDNGGTTPLNASTRFLSIQPYYSQTWIPTDKLSLTFRHTLSFNGKYREIPGTEVQVGPNYFLNYAVEHLVGQKRFNPGVSGEYRLALHGYWAQQLGDDKVNGQNLANSRESVFAVGPSFHMITKKGLVFEFKAAYEVDAVNRPQGLRSTVRFIKFFPPKQRDQAVKEKEAETVGSATSEAERELRGL